MIRRPRWLGSLWCLGLLALGLGVAACVAGLFFFGSAFLTPSERFFADPTTTMDQVRRDSLLGVLLVAAGGFVAPVGAVLSTVAFAFEMQHRTSAPRAAAPA